MTISEENFTFDTCVELQPSQGYFGLALVNGHLQAAYVESFFDRSRAVIGQNLADGRWHRVEVNITSGNVVISVDSFQTTLPPPRGSQAITDLSDTLHMGALVNQFSALGIALNNNFATFAGCSRRVTINGQAITFETAQRSGGFPLPRPGCKKDENCVPSSCANGGTCDATWTGFGCDCLNDFVGSQCENGKLITQFFLSETLTDHAQIETLMCLSTDFPRLKSFSVRRLCSGLE